MITIDRIVEAIQDQHFKFVLDLDDKEETYALFHLLNPLEEDKPFELVVGVVEDDFVLLVPNITKAEPLSVALCATSHTNYGSSAGWFGWDPEHHEIRFHFAMKSICGLEIDDSTVLQLITDQVPNAVRNFYIGFTRVIASDSAIPENLRNIAIDQMHKKLVEIEVFHHNANDDAPDDTSIDEDGI